MGTQSVWVFENLIKALGIAITYGFFCNVCCNLRHFLENLPNCLQDAFSRKFLNIYARYAHKFKQYKTSALIDPTFSKVQIIFPFNITSFVKILACI